MPFAFLDLPGEIRTIIYCCLLTSPSTLTIETASPSSMFVTPYIFSPQPSSHPISPSILLANHQTHHEALPLLYGTNTFRFGAPDLHERRAHTTSNAVFACWLRHIGARNAALLRSLSLDFPAYLARYSGGVLVDGYCMANFELVREKCAGVRVLEVDLYRDTSAEVLSVVRRHLEGTLPGLERVVVALQDAVPGVADEGVAERSVSLEELYGTLAEMMRGWGWSVGRAAEQRAAPSRLVRGRILPSSGGIDRAILRFLLS